MSTSTHDPNPLGGRPEPQLVIATVDSGAAPAAVRSALTLTDDDVISITMAATERHPSLETIVVATCNRTAIIIGRHTATLAEPDPATPVSAGLAIALLHDGIATIRNGHAPCLQAVANPRVYSGGEAVEHLFRVACGLESPLLGEAEILGQLRRAWHQAEQLGSAGPALRPLFRDAFALGKRVRSTTSISVGGAGLGSAVSTAVGDRYGSVVVIGAGQAGRTIARRLAKSGRPVTVVNRSLEPAAELAAEIGGRHIELADTGAVTEAIAGAAVIVGAASSAQPVITASMADSIRRSDPQWRPLVIDVATHPTVDTRTGVDVITLDRLTDRESDLAARRHRAIPEVERTVEITVDRHLARHAQRRDRLPRHHHRRPVGPNNSVTAQVAATPTPHKEHEPCEY